MKDLVEDIAMVELCIEQFRKGNIDAVDCWDKISTLVDVRREIREPAPMRYVKTIRSKLEHDGDFPSARIKFD